MSKYSKNNDNIFCFKLQARGSAYVVREYYNYFTFANGSISCCLVTSEYPMSL